MRILSILIMLLTFGLSCNKQNVSVPLAPGSPAAPAHSSPSATQTNLPSSITVLINNKPMTVQSISYSRGSSTFDFSARNDLQKVDVACYWFYQQSRWSFQYSDSINYSWRNDTLSSWNTTRAVNYGDVFFDCCSAPLTDSLVQGEYSGLFEVGKENLTISGHFRLLF